MTFLQAPDAKPDLLRMYKGPGNQNGVGTSYNIVKGMAADPATPPELFYLDSLTISYDFNPYSALVYAQIKWSGGSSPQVNCRIMRNGSALVTGPRVTNSANLAKASSVITANPGDYFEMWWRGEGSNFQRPILQAGQDTFLKIEPL